MCISVTTFSDAGFTGTGRYTGSCLSSSNISQANTYITNLNTFATAANTLYDNQKTTLSSASGSKYEGDALLTKYSNQVADYTALSSNFSTYYAYINAFQNRSTDLSSCAFFRTDMLIFTNTICFSTVKKFGQQTIWLAMMGPTLCLMAMCMFASIRCPLQKEEDKVGAGTQSPQAQAYYQPQNQYNYQQQNPQGYPVPSEQQQFQNVDKNPYNNYYPPQNQQMTAPGQLPPIDHKKHGLDI